MQRDRSSARQAIGRIPIQPQRQDSLTEQMQDLIWAADRLGLRDAGDYLRARFGNKYERAMHNHMDAA